MDKSKLLILIVHYNNSDEVIKYIENLQFISKTEELECYIYLVDNSLNFKKNIVTNNFFLITPNSNLGYLNACNLGLEKWFLENNLFPDLTLVSNTDISIPDCFNIHEVLNSSLENKHLGQISPLVYNKDNRIQNPHLYKRVSRLRILFYLLVFSNFITGYLYLNRKIGLRNRKDLEVDWIYTAHGSFFFLTKAFFDKGGKLSDSPFLYCEELYIGEQLRRIGLKSLLVKNQFVFHNEHQSTSLMSVRRKINVIFKSYLKIYNLYY